MARGLRLFIIGIGIREQRQNASTGERYFGKVGLSCSVLFFFFSEATDVSRASECFCTLSRPYEHGSMAAVTNVNVLMQNLELLFVREMHQVANFLLTAELGEDHS